MVELTTNILQHLNQLLPEVVLAFTIVLLVLNDLFFTKKKYSAYIVITGIVVTGVIIVWQYSSDFSSILSGFGNEWITYDTSRSFLKLLIVFASLIAVFLSEVSKEIKTTGSRKHEYYIFFPAMMLGMFLMVGTNDLFIAYIGVELLSFSGYFLVSFTDKPKNSEASVKYFLYGAVSTGLMLFGISLYYTLFGTTSFSPLEMTSSDITIAPISLFFIILLITVGIGYKVSAVPFHFWTPDIYEGAPLPVVAFLSVASKSAGIGLLLHFFFQMQIISEDVFGGDAEEILSILLMILSILSMVLGNVLALLQKNIKRMLAYSTIAHVGYILAALAPLSEFSKTSVLLYLPLYLYLVYAAFTVVIMVHNQSGVENIEEYKGIGKKQPLLGIVMAFAMFGLTGLPPTAGFIAKLYVILSVLDAKMVVLAILVLLNSVVSLYYYVRVLKVMYFGSDEHIPDIKLSHTSVLLLMALAIPILLFGIYFSPLLSLFN